MIVQKPWGSYIVLDEGFGWLVKKLIILPKARLSLQLHNLRSETWIVLEGSGVVEDNVAECHCLGLGSVQKIPRGEKHRVTCTSNIPLVILEIQFGVCKEDDIVRLEDDYGRVEKKSE